VPVPRSEQDQPAKAGDEKFRERDAERLFARTPPNRRLNAGTAMSRRVPSCACGTHCLGCESKGLNGGFMTRDTASLEAAHASIRSLIAVKLKYLVPMTIIFMVGYIGLTILAGFAKGVTGIKIIGAFNLGFLLIALNYLLSWVLAIIYTRVANNIFDPMSRKAIAELTAAGRAPR
jgi:uncharacterized membrane protein (DUF485 family)